MDGLMPKDYTGKVWNVKRDEEFDAQEQVWFKAFLLLPFCGTEWWLCAKFRPKFWPASPMQELKKASFRQVCAIFDGILIKSKRWFKKR